MKNIRVGSIVQYFYSQGVGVVLASDGQYCHSYWKVYWFKYKKVWSRRETRLKVLVP